MDAAQPAGNLKSESSRYQVPRERHRDELTVERSRFLCTVERVQSAAEAQSFIKSVQQEFAGATHNCWAYVVGAPGSTSQIGMSDDGEPHGTAGRPMLTVLLHSGIGEIAAVVTRWFGGIKLGTGGLARAYAGAVQQALISLPLVQRIDAVELQLVTDYSVVTQIQQLLASLNAVVTAERYTEVVTYDIQLDREFEEQLRTNVADLTRGQAVIARTTPSE